MMKKALTKVVAIAIMLTMVLSQWASAATYYSLTVTLSGPDGEGTTQTVTRSSGDYLSTTDALLPTVVQALYSASEAGLSVDAEVEQKFSGTGLRSQYGELVSAAKDAVNGNTTKWNNWVDSHVTSQDGKTLLKNLQSDLQDLHNMGGVVVATYNNHYTVTITLKKTGTGGTGGTIPPEEEKQVIVPVIGENQVQVSAVIEGTTAIISEITVSDLTETGKKDGDVVIVDLEHLDTPISSVILNAKSLKNIKNSGAKLQIALTTATVTIDQKTLDALLAHAASDDSEILLVVELNEVAEGTLNAAQERTIAKMNEPVVLDAFFTVDGKRVSDFQGGEVEIMATYYTTQPVRVWYVDEKGNQELVPSTFDGEKVTFVVTHFSHYVIELLSDVGYSNCPQDETCVYAGFGDLNPKAWYHHGVHFCVGNGMMVGVGKNVFEPNTTTSRAMVVMMLWRLEGEPQAKKASSYTDVKVGAWYSEAVAWAEETGVVLGFNDGTFRPNTAITREQAAAILCRYAKFRKVDVTPKGDLSVFSDESAISSWAYNEMKWCNGAGIIQGKGEGILDPAGLTKRCEIACMMQRYCVNVLKMPDLL